MGRSLSERDLSAMLEEVYLSPKIEDENYERRENESRGVPQVDVSILDGVIFQEEALTRKIGFPKVQVIPYWLPLWSSGRIF